MSCWISNSSRPHGVTDGQLLTQMPDPATYEPPDEAERKRRWQEMRDTLEEARWASPEAEARWQERQQRIDALNEKFRARAEEAAKPAV